MSSNFPSLLFSRQWQGGGFLMVPNSSLSKIVQVILGDMVQGAGNISQLHRTWTIIEHCEVGVTVKKVIKKHFVRVGKTFSEIKYSIVG